MNYNLTYDTAKQLYLWFLTSDLDEIEKNGLKHIENSLLNYLTSISPVSYQDAVIYIEEVKKSRQKIEELENKLLKIQGDTIKLKNHLKQKHGIDIKEVLKDDKSIKINNKKGRKPLIERIEKFK